MSLAENFLFDKSASNAFDWSNANGLSPNPYYKQKRENKSVSYEPKYSLFFCSYKVIFFASQRVIFSLREVILQGIALQ